MNHFKIKENGLVFSFVIRKNGTLELSDISPEGMEPELIPPVESGDFWFHNERPLVEIQETGKSTRADHASKHNRCGGSMDYKYQGCQVIEHPDGKEYILVLRTDYDVIAEQHMRFRNNLPIVQAWVRMENQGCEEIGMEYVSSFMYRNVFGSGEKAFWEKGEIYLGHNSWDCEAQWERKSLMDFNMNGMAVDGFNTPGISQLRYSYGSISSWTTAEYLPVGFARDMETGLIYVYEIETSGQWRIEMGGDPEKHFYVALGGPNMDDNGWWKNLKPGMNWETVPASFGIVHGNLSDAAALLTLHRRSIRRPNADDEKLNVVFNDYMNCLMGDPTEANEPAIIDRAAELGCEYYCMDAGWYDKGIWWDRVGEWKESRERFPSGLKSICDYVKSKGMVMGLWLEIEVMGTACPLAAELPDDWFVCRHGKRYIDKHRYMLDFRNPEVRKYCGAVIDRLIEEYGVGYFKIDYNCIMGYGSDLNTDSCSDSILEHYRALYKWYEEIFAKHPDLVIENCGSGGQRMDYGLLRLLSLQSTSDQTDYLYNSYIGAAVVTGVTPEQAGMWVYPYEDDAEHVIYNMVNGLLLRPYISGMVWKLSPSNMELMKEGINLYKKLRNEIRYALPEFPLGFCSLRDKALAYGLLTDKALYLSVMLPKTQDTVIPIRQKVTNVSIIYPSESSPSSANCTYSMENGNLKVHMSQMACARLFRLDLV